MRDGVVFERDAAGVGVDFDDRRVHGIAPGHGRRLPIGDLLEPSLDAGRSRVIPSRPRGLRDAGQAQRRAGHADNPDPALAQFEIGGRAFEQVGGDRENLVPQFRARLMYRGAGGHGAAARHRAEADRDRGGIGKGQHDILGLHLPQIGDDLREDRLHALALRSGAAGDINLARGVDAHKGALEGADTGAFDVAADTEPEIAAVGARLGLAAAKSVDAADRVERLLQRPGVIAAVINDRLAIAVRNPDAVGHLLGGDHVTAANFGGFETEGARDQIDTALHREGRFRAAGAAIGRVRHLVGHDNAAPGGQILDLVRPGQMHGGVVGDPGADRVPGAAIDEIIVADRENMAVIVKADLDIVPLVARMRRAHQMLATVLDPAHRAAEAVREEGDQEVFGVDMALAAKAAADVKRDAAHLCLRQAEQRGCLAPHPMHNLGRGPDRRRVGARVVSADDAAAFHRHGSVAVVIEATL